MSVENQRYAYAFLVDRGFAPNAAAGIVGNLIQESGVDPHSNQVGGPGMGIMQWSQGERWQSLLNFAQSSGKNPYSLDTQLQYMLHEMSAYGVTARMKKMNNLQSATRLFMNVMESPDPAYANLSARISFAQTIRAKDPNMPTGAGGGNNNGGGGNGQGGGGGGNNNDPQVSRAEYGFSQPFLEHHPEIRDMVDKAHNQQWTVERFLAEVKSTQWWRQTTASQRQWQKLLSEEPAEAKNQLEQKAQDVKRIAASLGVDLTGKDVSLMAERAARSALDDVDLQHLIARKYQYGDKAETGNAAVTVDQLRDIADSYGIKMDRNTMDKMTSQVLSGDQTVEAMIDRIREQAKMLYPNLGKQLDTHTVADLLDPYKNMAADELGIPTVNMRTSDPKWLRFISGRDGPMTMDEAQALVRTNKQYGFDTTSKARGESAQFATDLITAMTGR